MGNSKNKLGLVFKLALYGDSLACPRQGVVNSDERYIARIENHIRTTKSFDYLEIRDRAIGGATLSNLYKEYLEDNSYYSLPGDILIIHSGIVDCAPRPVNQTTRDRISKLPGFMRNWIIGYIHRNRAKLLKQSGGYVKTDQVQFSKVFNVFLNHAILNYDKVFIINICPTTRKIEAHSPGFSDNITNYNRIINKAIATIDSGKIHLVDVNNLILSEADSIEKYIVAEDGHHIHPLTHNWIADQIIAKI